MTDTKDLIREIQEHTAAHGGENTATHLLVQAVMALQRQADELAAIGAGGVEPLRKINQPEPTVPDQTQDWAGMDGATAYLLIQRHADNWADAAKMMGEWLDANQRQSFDAADMAAAAAQGFRDGVASVSAGPDDIDAIALTRYKVVRSHDSMFHRFAVVAGDGKQQLYLGRETECQNMTRKFAGAFLDGAFYQSQIAAAPGPADGESNE